MPERGWLEKMAEQGFIKLIRTSNTIGDYSVGVLKRFVETQDAGNLRLLAKDLIDALSLALEGNPEAALDVITPWGETAEICLDPQVMADIEAAKTEGMKS